MISVAMTTYNGEKYIERQLLSIFKQTKRPDEVIIVDDCSTDNTVEMIVKFINHYELSQRWKLIKLTSNVGFVESFNRAIRETKGEFIFLCDQDDIWLPNKIEIMSKIMLMNPTMLALTSGFKKIDANDNELYTRNSPFSSNNNLIRQRIKPNKCIMVNPFNIVTYNISPGCTCVFRKRIKDIFEKLNMEGMELVHDWKINTIASLMDGLYFLNTPLTLYRLHDNNTIGLKRNMTIASRLQATIKSATERKYMKNIISILVKEGIVCNLTRIHRIKVYIKELERCHIERGEALKRRNFLYSFYLIFKYNLFKNRGYENIVLDIFAIINHSIKRRKV